MVSLFQEYEKIRLREQKLEFYNPVDKISELTDNIYRELNYSIAHFPIISLRDISFLRLLLESTILRYDTSNLVKSSEVYLAGVYVRVILVIEDPTNNTYKSFSFIFNITTI